MGEVEIDSTKHKIIIHSHFIIYGNAANEMLAEQIRNEIATMWNEPGYFMDVNHVPYKIEFNITAEFASVLDEVDVYENMDPKNNYFRIEEFVYGDISFVDGIGCNSGYFKLANLTDGSTTAAHEYGHTLGLVHPELLDIRGEGVPGIMYPRGTLVDAAYQYNPSGQVGDNSNGGTLNPMHRKVTSKNIADLKIYKLDFYNGRAVLGEFTNAFHPDHKDIPPDEFYGLNRFQPQPIF